MPMPDLNEIMAGWFGGSWSSSIGVGTVGGGSNILIGTNPPYGLSDFLAVYPKFGAVDSHGTFTGVIPQVVIEMYIALASACLQQVRWQDSWVVGMALFIAHYCTLWLQSEGSPGTDAASIAASGLAIGVQVSQSAGGVSVGLESLNKDFGGWGAMNLTLYGQQLETMANIVGFGCVYVY